MSEPNPQYIKTGREVKEKGPGMTKPLSLKRIDKPIYQDLNLLLI